VGLNREPKTQQVRAFPLRQQATRWKWSKVCFMGYNGITIIINNVLIKVDTIMSKTLQGQRTKLDKTKTNKRTEAPTVSSCG